MQYPLSEAYYDLYFPKKIEETVLFYDNLRFVDHLDQQDIQETMESLLWEFMDYGNTLDESYFIIESIFSDNVLEEAIEITKSYYLNEGIGSAISRGGEWIERQEGRAGRFLERAKQNLKDRKSKVETALSSARKSIQNSPKTVPARVKSQIKKAGDAALRRIVRTASSIVTSPKVQALGPKLQKLGSKVRTSGKKSRTITPYSTTQSNTTVGAPFRTDPKGSSRREKIGGALIRAGEVLKDPKYHARTGFLNRYAAERLGVRGPGMYRNPEKRREKITIPVVKDVLKRGVKKIGKTLGLREDFEYIISMITEDLVKNGYANSYESAAIILENLSEDMFYNLVNQYID